MSFCLQFARLWPISARVTATQPIRDRILLVAGLVLSISMGAGLPAVAQDQPAPQQPAVRKVGTIKAINGKTVTLKVDTGTEVRRITFGHILKTTEIRRFPI